MEGSQFSDKENDFVIFEHKCTSPSMSSPFTGSFLESEVVRRSSDNYNSESISDEEVKQIQKRQSRIVSELRPVERPESALMNIPDNHSMERDDGTIELFAAERVRTTQSWLSDLYSYMKNCHLVFGICMAHRDHPFKRGDRCLVLFIALFTTLLLSGLFANRDCCTEVNDTPIAVVNRRLERNILLEAGSESNDNDSNSGAVRLSEKHCLAFYADCSHKMAICPQGSRCQAVTIDESINNATIAMQCVPDETILPKCVTRRCPIGWRCRDNASDCMLTTNFVCDMSELRTNESDGHSETEYRFHKIDDNQYKKILGLVKTLGIPANQTKTTSKKLLSTTLATESEDSSSQTFESTSNLSSESLSSESATVRVAINEPANDQVYSLASIILIEWRVVLLSGPDPGLNLFQVDFSADNGAFTLIATNISPINSQPDANTSVYQYYWNLANNTSWLCTRCVLRVCALDVPSVADNSLCLRSDRPSARRRRLQTSTVDDDDITFRIVREVIECACGLNHEPYLLAASIIAGCIPIVAQFAEPLVTFYRDLQLFGLFARRDGPVRPLIAWYATESATQKGRTVLIGVTFVLCVAFGILVAQITTTNFLTEKDAIIVLWIVTFGIAVALGTIVYCTLLRLLLFNVRWWREGPQESIGIDNLSQSRYSVSSMASM
ncbi:hypothetical protein Plhal304r1_c008g0031051 [Plasmopara halstedii]